ncbi:tape measure protein [Delftia acidovorans]|uniref:tape measure protein n=1 Tax=Delftia acidovorans TaxID=80866 RepID=UPI0028A5BCCD|nr:tape measure protein [Delftia acidovorans]
MECSPIPKDLESEALSAEAWNHLMEYAPRLVRAAAEGLGVSLGAIRQMAAEGRITSAVLAGALQGRPTGTPAEASARLTEIDAKYYRSGDLAGFLREVGAAGLTLEDLADWLAAAGASGIPKFAVGGLHPGDIPVSKSVAAAHLATIQPATSNPWSEALALGREIVRLNTQIASLLQRWDGEGMPIHRCEE